MLTDIEIAQQAKLLPIQEIASRAGIPEEELEYYGKYKAKVRLSLLSRLQHKPNGKLILVTAITATPAGDGKTCTAVGVTQALGKLGKKVILCLREPSLGPTFGIKGGAAGGGYSQVLPMEDINLHFTGDIHAVGTAHNLLAAMVDNHIARGNELDIDPTTILWKRVVDMNDRALRHIIIGLGGRVQGGVPRESGFDITVASEVMACLALCTDLQSLKERLARIVVGYTFDKKPVTAGDLKAAGAMTLLLKDAINPNLVQTIEGQPAFVHCGPFGNIAHGTNSILATKMALKLADYVVTEAGFATDLGAEKFCNIVCRTAGFAPDAAILVATIRALHMHGGVEKDKYSEPNLPALKKGIANLDKHIENVQKFGVPVIVAINRFPNDTGDELNYLIEHCRAKNVACAISDVVAKGGAGGIALAESVLETLATTPSQFHYLYDLNLPITEKIRIIATEIYGADGVVYTHRAENDINSLNRNGFSSLPICMAKTQLSLSDDQLLKGAPKGWNLTVREVKISAGAGFLVAYTGDIMTMPGLPEHPAAENIDIDANGKITGLF
ncbi:MAG: formate--tetrahydrofolate ligase [bacterium]|nr:formate--tetrahydrofolate ligase [bacterium]